MKRKGKRTGDEIERRKQKRVEAVGYGREEEKRGGGEEKGNGLEMGGREKGGGEVAKDMGEKGTETLKNEAWEGKNEERVKKVTLNIKKINKNRKNKRKKKE